MCGIPFSIFTETFDFFDGIKLKSISSSGFSLLSLNGLFIETIQESISLLISKYVEAYLSLTNVPAKL